MQAVAVYNVRWNHGVETSRKLVKVYTGLSNDFTPLQRAKIDLSELHGEFIGDTFIDSTYMSSEREFVSIPMCSDRCLRTVIEDVFIDRNGNPRRYKGVANNG